LTRDVLAAIDQQYGDGIRIFQTIIRRSVRFGESAVAGQSILSYDPAGAGATAYRAVAQEMLQSPSPDAAGRKRKSQTNGPKKASR
jgi:chromosome partitioning protein